MKILVQESTDFAWWWDDRECVQEGAVYGLRVSRDPVATLERLMRGSMVEAVDVVKVEE